MNEEKIENYEEYLKSHIVDLDEKLEKDASKYGYYCFPLWNNELNEGKYEYIHCITTEDLSQLEVIGHEPNGLPKFKNEDGFSYIVVREVRDDKR